MSSNKFLGLRTVIYNVENIEKATKWYAKALDQNPYFDEPFYVGFNVSGYELGLQPIESEDFNRGNNEVVYWGVKDIHKSFNRLVDLGAKPNNQPENVGGEIMVASVKDPWGNILGIIYNPEFKAE